MLKDLLEHKPSAQTFDLADLANSRWRGIAALAGSTAALSVTCRIEPSLFSEGKARLFLYQSGGQDQERRHKKRRGEFYSVQTSLIVAALKKMLPIGLNMCTPGDQELISLAKMRYLLVRCACTGRHYV